MKIAVLSSLAAAVAISATPAHASVLLDVESYDLLNGGVGSFRYFDTTYNGSGDNTVVGASLSGGTGDLTDGVVASASWFDTHKITGDGPYVGWNPAQPGGANPLITFNFGNDVLVDTFRIYIDNVEFGGVLAPSQILLNGQSYAFAAPALGTQGWVDIGGLSLNGSTHTVQLIQNNGAWVMASEVQFFGTAQAGAVPEPATWALMLLGFFGIGAMMRRRETQSVSVSYS